MSPPTSKPKPRAVRRVLTLRVEAELYDRLVEAADERDVSMTWMVNKAITEFLPRLIPIDDFRLTQRGGE